MSGEDAHVGLISSSSNSDGAAATGGLGALDLSSGLSAPLVRGGAPTPPDVAPPPFLFLPSPSVTAGVAASLTTAVGCFSLYESRLPPNRRVFDFGGGGDCGFNCFGVGAVLMGRLLPVSDCPLEGLVKHQRAYGEQARSRCVAHARLMNTLSAVIADSGAGGGDLILFAEAIVSSMASWPGLRSALSAQDLTSVSVESWLSAMSRSQSDELSVGRDGGWQNDRDHARMGVYADSGALLILADFFRARVVCKLIGSDGLELPSSPQIFLPRVGSSPAWEITLVCQPDVHFMLEITVLPDAAPSPPSLTDEALAYRNTCERVRALEAEFCAQQTDLRVATSVAAEADAQELREQLDADEAVAWELHFQDSRPSSPLPASDEIVLSTEEAWGDSLAKRRRFNAANLPYISACSLLFGRSSAEGCDVILLVCSAGSPFPAQAISESREDADEDAVGTALRGIAEELLGLAEGSPEAFAMAEAFAARLSSRGYLPQHLGASPTALHRSFALPADMLFDDGIDGALRRFSSNSEIGCAILVRLDGVTGALGELEVRCVNGFSRPLRGGRHLGQGRIDFIRRYLRSGWHWSSDDGPLPPPSVGSPHDDSAGGNAEKETPSTGLSSGPGDEDHGGGTAGIVAALSTSSAREPAAAPELLVPPVRAVSVQAGHNQSWAVRAARAELASFTWPLTSLAEVGRLLHCSHIAPTDLVGFEFSGAVRSSLEAVGRRALSVDYRECELGGMHAMLDVRDVLALQRWSRVFLFPPCFQQLRADEDCLQAKIDDGRAFWGCALVIFCFCVAADLLVVEQPDTIVADFVSASFTEFRTSSFGDSPDKFVRLFIRNGALAAPFAPDPSARRRPPHYLTFPSSDARDRAKSTWLPFANLCRAMVRLLPISDPSPEPTPYSLAIEQFAQAWHAAGHPVPRGYLDPYARPPFGSRRYQRVRGPGDGRAVDAVVPARMDSGDALGVLLPRGGAMSSDAAALPLLDLREMTEAASLLVFVSVLLQPLVYAHVNGFTIHGVLLPEGHDRPSYVQAVQPLVALAVGATSSAFLVGEYVGGARLSTAPLDYRPPRRNICSTTANRLLLLAAGATFVWCTLASLRGTPMADAAARSLLACAAYVKPGHQLVDFPPSGFEAPLRFRCGAAPAVSVLARPLLTHVASPPAWRAVAESIQANSQLIAALNAASEDALLSGWVDRIKPLDPSDIPPSLLSSLPSYSDAGLERSPFSPVYRPLRTAWLPLPPRQPPVPDGAPSCIASPFEMMLPSTRTLVVSWLREALQDMIHIRATVAEGKAAEMVAGSIRRSRPRALAVGRNELYEWARDRVWDCRSACCQLLDFRAPIRTHLNLDYLRRRLESYPDQHLVSNVLEGVRLEADVEDQSVFVPHLVSMPTGFKSVSKEVRRLRSLSWYEFFPDFPFWPLYLNGQGSVARKLEPDRYRRTTEGGGPRQPTFDLSGLEAISINAASFVHHMPAHFVRDQRPEMREWLAARGLPAPTLPEGSPRRSKWPKEAKPRLSQLLRDLAILKRAAALLGLAVFIFGDDFKDYFNQLAMAECELHKLNILFLRDDDELAEASAASRVPLSDAGQLIFISELRLGFGTHPASNIAQRFSDAILSLFREDMDSAEASHFSDGSSGMATWLTERRVAAQAVVDAECLVSECSPAAKAARVEQQFLLERRLFSCHVYTDDPVWITVGTDRTLRALRAWRQLTNGANLIMAIPEKRHLGNHAPWLGVLILAGLGLVIVPRSKLVRAAGTITHVLQGGQPFHVYRSLIGLLEHLRDVNLRGRNVMHGLYAPHQTTGASQYGPSGRVFCDELMAKQLRRWLHLLRQSAGVSARHAFAREEIEPFTGITVFACSDACLGDDDPAGMGGYCHGLYWQFVVPPAYYEMVTTPLLEFLAVAFNILTFVDHAASLCGDEGTLLLRTDALTTAMVLPRETQQSPSMVDAYQLLTETEAWRLLLPRLRIQHVYGDTHAISDPLSRSHWSVFRQRCRQLAVKPIHLPLPSMASQLLERVVSLEAARRVRVQRPLVLVTGGASLKDDPPSFLQGLCALERREATQPPARLLDHFLRPESSVSPLPGAVGVSFLQSLGAYQPAADAPPPMAPPRQIGQLTLPGLNLTNPALQRYATGRLAAAASKYAAARTAALAAGPDPAMTLRSNLADLCKAGEALHEFSEFGTNVNTLKKDDRAWEFWEHICEQLGTSPLRTADDVRSNPERQAFLLGVLMLYASAVCVPRTAGRQCIKPRSALAYPLAIIRIFSRWGIAMPGFKSLQAELAGLQRAYLAYHGPKSLAPIRAEPMRFLMVRQIHDILCDGSIIIGRRTWNDSSHDVFMFRRLNAINIRGGWRLAEWVWHASGELMYMCRCDLWWRLKGRIVKDPSDAEMDSLDVGDTAFLAPPRSKPDQWGEIHCPFPVTLPFDRSPDNAAAALRDIEKRCPCHGADRERMPIIATAEGNPYTHAVLDNILHNVLVYRYGAAMASLFSWHSYRSGLCTALFAAGCPDAVNQLICRWMCPESLHVYRRMGTSEHAAWVRKAAAADVDTIQAGNAPKVVADQNYAELFNSMSGSGATRRNHMQDWASALANNAAGPVVHTPVTPMRTKARTAPSPATAVPPSAAQPLTPLSRGNAVGRRVLVPATLYPQYKCSEHAGTGWEGLVLSATAATAVVRFLHDRAADGRPYQDERLPLDRLQPL